MAEQSAASRGEALWYVAGVVATPPALADLPTLLPDRPLEAIAGNGLCAVACTVPTDLLDEQKVTDLGHLGRIATTHDRLLRALAERTTVVPARLGSLYSSREAVAEMLDRGHRALTAALQRLSGRSEWGVKAYAQPASGQAKPADDAPTGTAYLRRKQAERQRRTADEEATAALAAKLHRELAAQAHAAVIRPPQHPRLSPARAPMLLNATYLVDRARTDAFGAAVRDLADRHRPVGLRVELTGPWPPYSFAGSGEDRA